MAAGSSSSTSLVRGSRWRDRWLGRLTLAVVGVLMTLGFIAYLTAYFGYVEGQEFSPESFRRRSFSYYELPLVHLQIWPITREDCTGALENYLRDNKLVSISKGAAPTGRWDLVVARRGAAATSSIVGRSDAEILCYYLDAVDAKGDSVWLAWSKKHAPQAAVLWPEIAHLARQHLYLLMPEVLGLIHREATAEQIRGAIAGTLAQKCCFLAESQQQLGRHSIAIDLYSVALRYDPGLEDALQGRARSLQEVKKSRADAAASVPGPRPQP